MRRALVADATTAGAALAVTAVAVVLDPAAGPLELLFGSVVLTALLLLLRLALRAARQARRERRSARRLVGTPVEAVVRRAVVEERVRLAADIEAVVRAAVLRMEHSAGAALEAWERDPAPLLRGVQEEGQRATSELRRLLGLLREAEDPGVPPGQPPAPAPVRAGPDLLLAAAAALVTLGERALYGDAAPTATASAASTALTALAAATIGLRRPLPVAGAVACAAVFAVAGAVGHPVMSGLWMLVTLGGLAWACTVRQARLPAGLAGAGVLLTAVTVSQGRHDPVNLGFTVLVVVAGAAGGLAVRWWNGREHAAHRRGSERAAELARAAEEAVRSERLGVARELHDLISSAMGVMVVHAGAAQALRSTDPAAARAALDVVRRTAAATLGELAQLTAAIGSGALGAPAPAAGLVEHRTSDLHDLVERMRGAGLTVTLTVPPQLDVRLATAVYRIVQESLTNVARHAPGADVDVVVGEGPGGVTVDVLDDGPGRGSTTRRGYGLVGIAERVERLGGSLETGPGPDGTGFRVRARIPLSVGLPA